MGIILVECLSDEGLSVFYPKGYVQVKKPLLATQKNGKRTRFGLFRPRSPKGFKLAIVTKTEMVMPPPHIRLWYQTIARLLLKSNL